MVESQKLKFLFSLSLFYAKIIVQMNETKLVFPKFCPRDMFYAQECKTGTICDYFCFFQRSLSLFYFHSEYRERVKSPLAGKYQDRGHITIKLLYIYRNIMGIFVASERFSVKHVCT